MSDNANPPRWINLRDSGPPKHRGWYGVLRSTGPRGATIRYFKDDEFVWPSDYSYDPSVIFYVPIEAALAAVQHAPQAKLTNRQIEEGIGGH